MNDDPSTHASSDAPAARRRVAPRRISTLWLLAVFVASVVALKFSVGFWTWASLVIAAASASASIARAAARLPPLMRPERAASMVRRTGLCVASVFLMMALSEAALYAHQQFERRRLRAGATNAWFLTIPPEWERRRAPEPGAKYTHYWHGKLHEILDDTFMRRTTPFPARTADVCRIAVFGDSNTYGHGVAADEAYPAVLQAELQSEFRVEVLNLGVFNYNSQDVADAVRQYVPQLAPDLVVYGVNLNDYISRAGELAKMAAAPPPPTGAWDRVAGDFVRRTLVAKFLARGFDDLMMKLGRRQDYFAQASVEADRNETRFKSDVTTMNQFVVGGGRPPIVAIVVNQFPSARGPGFDLTTRTQSILRDAGMDVVPIDAFLREYDGRSCCVSHFDGHPDAATHRVFADILASHLKSMRELQAFRRR